MRSDLHFTLAELRVWIEYFNMLDIEISKLEPNSSEYLAKVKERGEARYSIFDIISPIVRGVGFKLVEGPVEK